MQEYECAQRECSKYCNSLRPALLRRFWIGDAAIQHWNARRLLFGKGVVADPALAL